MDIELVTSAAVFAAERHAGQQRKELNQPYINHPLRVAKMAAELHQSAEFIAAALLHDVIEDTNTPIKTVSDLFPAKTVALVIALTKWWGASDDSPLVAAHKAAYAAQIIRTPGAPLLKVLDRIDNLNDFATVARLSASSHRWAKKYHAKTMAEFPHILAALDDTVGQPDTIREDMTYAGGWTKPGTADRARKLFAVALAGLEAAL